MASRAGGEVPGASSWPAWLGNALETADLPDDPPRLTVRPQIDGAVHRAPSRRASLHALPWLPGQCGAALHPRPADWTWTEWFRVNCCALSSRQPLTGRCPRRLTTVISKRPIRVRPRSETVRSHRSGEPSGVDELERRCNAALQHVRELEQRIADEVARRRTPRRGNKRRNGAPCWTPLGSWRPARQRGGNQEPDTHLNSSRRQRPASRSPLGCDDPPVFCEA